MSPDLIHHKHPSPSFVSSNRACHTGFRKIFGERSERERETGARTELLN